MDTQLQKRPPTQAQPAGKVPPEQAPGPQAGPAGAFNDYLKTLGEPEAPTEPDDASATFDPAAMKTVRRGASGEAVRVLQSALNAAGAHLAPDARFGPKTEAAVKSFQGGAGLTTDGVAGPLTWQALSGAQSGGQTSGVVDVAGEEAAERPVLKRGARGPAVSRLQGQLNLAQSGFVPEAGAGLQWPKVGDDGVFGALTEAAVQAFEIVKGATPTGVVAGWVWDSLEAWIAERKADAMLQPLVEGQYIDQGAYEEVDGRFARFTDAKLQGYLEMVTGLWGLTPVDPPKGGDTKESDVKDHPLWVRTFQARLAGKGPDTYRRDSHAARRLVEAYLRAWSVQKAGGGKAASNLEELYGHMGDSQGNDRAKPLGGKRDAANWCDNASLLSVVRGLMRNGMRFDVPARKTWPEEMATQAAQVDRWADKRGAGRKLWSHGCDDAPLFAGDIIMYVTQGHTNLTGHTATVMFEQGNLVAHASGNAGGKAVRTGQIEREKPPADFDADALARQLQATQARDKADKKLDKLRQELALAEQGQPLPGKMGPPRAPETIRAEIAATEAERDKQAGKMNPVDQNAGTMTLKDGRVIPIKPKRPNVGWIYSIRRTDQLDAHKLNPADADQMKANGLTTTSPGDLKARYQPIVVQGQVLDPGCDL